MRAVRKAASGPVRISWLVKREVLGKGAGLLRMRRGIKKVERPVVCRGSIALDASRGCRPGFNRTRDGDAARRLLSRTGARSAPPACIQGDTAPADNRALHFLDTSSHPEQPGALPKDFSFDQPRYAYGPTGCLAHRPHDGRAGPGN